jgi:hypothetical protein
LRNLRRALDRKRVEGEALELQKRLEQLVFERTAQLSSALQSAEERYENTLLALGQRWTCEIDGPPTIPGESVSTRSKSPDAWVARKFS